MTHDSNVPAGRIPELDGVRGVAIGLVVFWHYVASRVPAHALGGAGLARLLPAGAVAATGVDLFFVLSGFLLGGILLDHRGAGNLLRVFYARRFFRIVPVYAAWFLAFLASTALGATAPAWLFAKPLPLWSYALYVQNFAMASEHRFGPHWLAVTWSLAIEEQFYLLLPVLVLLLRPRVLLGVSLALVVSGPPVRAWFLSRPAATVVDLVVLPCRWDSLFLGVVGAFALRWPPLAKALRASPRATLGAFAALAGALALFTLREPAFWARRESWIYGGSALAVVYLAFIVAALHAPREGTFRRLLRNRLLVALGGVAYGVYLFHEAAAGLWHHFARGSAPTIGDGRALAVTALAFATTLGLAFASFRWLEAPLIRFGHRMRYAPPVGPATAETPSVLT